MTGFCLVSPNSVGLLGSVDPVHKLCRQEVTQILHAVWSRVYVVVTSFSMVTEAVGVLHTQIQALLAHTHKKHVTKRFTSNSVRREQLLHLQGLWTRAPTGR